MRVRKKLPKLPNGNPGGNGPEREIEGHIAPRTSSDTQGRGRDGVVVGEAYYGPSGVDLQLDDQVFHRGAWWDIEGDVAEYRSPFGPMADGTYAALKRGQG